MFFLTGWALLVVLVVSSGAFSQKDQVHSEEIKEYVFKSPTPTEAPTPTITPVPTKEVASQSPSPKPTQTTTQNSPAPTQVSTNVPASTSDIGLTLMKQINDFRTGKGLSPFSTDGYTCAFAVTRAGEITGGFSHDGFSQRINSKTLPYPSYSSVAENIAMNSDPNAVVPGWINSPGHNENMSKNAPLACVGKSGNYYALEVWKP